MSGVDIADQHVAANTMSHRMLKWWKKVILCNMFNMNIAIVKVIHKALSNSPFNSTNFRMDIICGLLIGYEKPQRAFSRPSGVQCFRLAERHFPAMNPNMTPAGSQYKPDCEVCSDRSKGKAGVGRHQTSHFYVECRVPLCPYPCFQRYHTFVNYKVVCTPELHK